MASAPTSGDSVGSGSLEGAGGGIGRSAPIRTGVTALPPGSTGVVVATRISGGGGVGGQRDVPTTAAPVAAPPIAVSVASYATPATAPGAHVLPPAAYATQTAAYATKSPPQHKETPHKHPREHQHHNPSTQQQQPLYSATSHPLDQLQAPRLSNYSQPPPSQATSTRVRNYQPPITVREHAASVEVGMPSIGAGSVGTATATAVERAYMGSLGKDASQASVPPSPGPPQPSRRPDPQPLHPRQTDSYQVPSHWPTSDPPAVAEALAATATQRHHLQSPPRTQQHQRQPSPPPSSRQTKSPPASPPRRNPHPKRNPPSTPDEEIDAFLLGSHYYDLPAQHRSPLGQPRESNKPPRTRPRPLPPNEAPPAKARTLASRRAWGDVLRVTNDALNGSGSRYEPFHSELVQTAAQLGGSDVGGGTDGRRGGAGGGASGGLRQETCELIFLRFEAHLKLRRYADLGKEVQRLGLLPHFASRPSSPESGTGTETDRVPAWVPYGLRIVAAQHLQYTESSSRSVDMLNKMRDRVVRTEHWNTKGMEHWRYALDNALANAYCRRKEWRLALSSLESLLDGLSDGAEREVYYWSQSSNMDGLQLTLSDADLSQMKELIAASGRVEVRSRQILVLLQAGAIDEAITFQAEVRNIGVKVKQLVTTLDPPSLTPSTAAVDRFERESALARQVPVRVMVNDGMLSFAQNKFSDASEIFQKALIKQREIRDTLLAASETDPSLAGSFATWKDLSSPTLAFDVNPTLMVECLNNLALCALYAGRMRTAVHIMEELVREDPTAYLTEGIAFNLCTLYDLGSDGDECARRKKVLQRVAKRFFLHDVGVESFRLNG